MAEPNLVILVVLLVTLVLLGGPLEWQTGDAPPKKGNGVGQIRETLHLMILGGLFPSLPMKNTAQPNCVILVVFLVTFRI